MASFIVEDMEPILVNVKIRPQNATYRNMNRFIVAVNTEATESNLEPLVCDTLNRIEGEEWFATNLQFPQGNPFLAIGVLPDFTEAYTVDVFLTPLTPPVDQPTYYVGTFTASQWLPARVSVTVFDTAPFIQTEVQQEYLPAYPEPRIPQEIVVNDPRTGTLVKAIGSLAEGITQRVSSWWDNVINVAGLAGSIVNNLFTSLLNAIPQLLSRSATQYAEQTVTTIDDIKSGSPSWANFLKYDTSKLWSMWTNPALQRINLSEMLENVVTPPDFLIKSQGVISAITDYVVRGTYEAMAVELASFGQIEGWGKIGDRVFEMTGLPDIAHTLITHPVEMGFITPYRYAVNQQHPTLIPPYTDLINMRVKEKLEQPEFDTALAMQGYSKYWAGKIWDAHFNAPSYGEIVKAYYRTNMTDERLLQLLERVDLDPEYNAEVWLPNIEEIPNISELINQRVKEVIPQSIFADNIRKWGYNPEWAKRIWDAHFIPPSLMDILTAYRRQVPVTIPEVDEATGQPKPRAVDRLSLDDVHKLMELVDLDPRYNTIFDVRLYNDPSIRDARYMYEIGAYDESQVKDVLRRRGYNETDQENLTRYLVSFRERGYYTKFLTAIQTGYMYGVVSDEELKVATGKIEFPLGIDYWIKQIASIRRRIAESGSPIGKTKILTLGELKKGYLRDIINEDDFRTRLMLMGYEDADITLLINILAQDKITETEGQRVISLTITQLLQAYRYQLLSEDELKTRIMLKGLSQEETSLLVETTKKKWAMGGVESA